MATKSDFEKIAKILSKKDLSEDQFKILESLLPKIFSAYDAVGTESISYTSLLNQHKDKRRMLESLKELYDDEAEFAKSSNAVDIRLRNKLQRRLLLNLERNDLTEQEVEHIKDTIKVLEKSIESRKKFITGLAKGEALTDSLLQSTLGISRSWAGEAGMGGIKGAIKGFTRGIKDNLTATNALATIMSFTVGQLVKLDEVRASLFMTTGIQDVTDELAGMTADYADVFGREAPEVAAEVFKSARTNIRNREIEIEGFQNGAFKQIGLLQQQSVSMDAFTTIYGDYRMALGRTDQEASKIGVRLKKFAKRIKRPPEEIFRETAENLPFLSRYGTEFENTFVSLAITGKETNLAISELISLGDSLDSIEMSSRVAAKINALLGQRVMDVAEFTIAGAEEKAQMIGEGLREYENQHGQINQRVFRSISNQIGGMSESSLMKLKNAGTSGLARTLDAADPSEGLEDTLKDLKSELSQKEKLETALAKMGQAFTVKIAQNKRARSIVNLALDNFELAAGALVGTVLGLKAINAASGLIGTPLRPKRIIDTNPASSMGDIDPRQGGRRGAGRGSQFRNQPGRFGTGRGRMFIGRPESIAAPKQSFFQRMLGGAKSGIQSGFNFVKSGATSAFNYLKSGGTRALNYVKGATQSISPSQALRTVGNSIKSGALSIGKSLLKWGPIAALIESVFLVGDIRDAIAGGMKGAKLNQYVGASIMDSLGGVLGGIAGAALLNYLVAPLTAFLGLSTAGTGAAVLATSMAILGYYLGDMVGRWVFGKITEGLGPSAIGSLGKFALGLFYDEGELSGPSTLDSEALPAGQGKRLLGRSKVSINANNDKFVQKKMTPEQSPSDPILSSLTELVEIIEKNETSSNDVILEVGFTRIGTVTV